MDWIYVLNVIGVLVFAISGVLAARASDFDVVGCIIIGFITALGGGTLRDVLLGETPVSWMLDVNYLIVVFIATLLSYTFRDNIKKFRKGRFFFDSMGLGLFTILGMQKTLELGLHPIIALLMGVVSAVFGGVTRDVLSNIVPLIFRSEIYATACVAGGLLYLGLNELAIPDYVSMISSMVLVFIIRYFAVKRKWSLKV